jgi:N-acetylglucosamine-6-phosphate deacetylase
VLLDPEAAEPAPGALLLDGERIEARLPSQQPAPDDAERVDLEGRLLAPGFVDLHHHGSAIFAPSGDLAAALARDGRALARRGTTAYLPTSVAWPAAQLAAHVEELAAALATAPAGASRPVGLHLEGPWISAAAAGAQPAGAIRAYDPREGEALLAAAGGALRMVTLAPEVENAARLLELLTRSGVVAALGHSAARGEQVDAAVARGAAHVTHLFNAMGPLHQRRPGLAAAALADDRLTCDLICDGAHVDPRWVRVAARSKQERLVLITDRVDPGAAPAGFGSGALHDDGVALRLRDGRLAGSCVTLDRALRNALAWGAMTQLEAVAACTLRPARVLGMEAELGTLRPGARADLVVLDAEGQVRETWIGGQPLRV